ncbi:MAG: hypothetical protein AAGF73_03085 [Actinomycetota bacterium]
MTRFGIADQSALAILSPDWSVETVAGAVDDWLLKQIVTESA